MLTTPTLPPSLTPSCSHVSEGGWPFSTSAHGWPISDCTAEGLKGVLALIDAKCIAQDNTLVGIEAERLYKAINVILTLQVIW